MAVAPYLAGLDTVANTVGCLVHYALKNPDVLARIQQEMDDNFVLGQDVSSGLSRTSGSHGQSCTASRHACTATESRACRVVLMKPHSTANFSHHQEKP